MEREIAMDEMRRVPILKIEMFPAGLALAGLCDMQRTIQSRSRIRSADREGIAGWFQIERISL